ncbi:hypothetical protein [Clostridium polynesiense]|uniref:hypothetical protein n=1 Tax=Clostridium polynesiense TaxID=1325933 RepID=UPI00058CECA6|nr:hypothetical protein [Clostridium polynesiense]
MLNLTKSIQITGQSVIDGQQVVYMTANITTEGNQPANVNKSVMNQEIYSRNLKECRSDIKDFEAQVYKIEDEILGGKNSVNK